MSAYRIGTTIECSSKLERLQFPVVKPGEQRAYLPSEARKLGALGHSLEQRSSQLVLQRSDCIRKRGLGNAATMSRPNEALFFRQGQEIAELLERHFETSAPACAPAMTGLWCGALSGAKNSELVTATQ